MKAEINSNNLRLARERLNLSIDDAAKKIGISNPGHLELAEKGEEQITFKQLKKAAKVYGISFGYFYLETFPYEDIPITDYRMDPNYYGKPESTALLKAIYFATTKREEILEIGSHLDYDFPEFNLSCKITDNIEKVAKKIRASFPDYCFANKAEVIKRLIKQIESMGVYVARVGGESHNKVDYEEFDGAAIYYNLLPIILLNADNIDKNRNRIVFTIFHEFTHLLLKNSALTTFYSVFEKQNYEASVFNVEVFCNKVAAATLIPANHLQENFNGNNILELATNYRVSRQVVAIRLKNLNLISQNECNALLQKYKKDYELYAPKESKRSGPIDPNVVKKRNLGDLYIHTVRDAISNNYLSYFDALKSLGMKDKAAKKVLYGE